MHTRIIKIGIPLLLLVATVVAVTVFIVHMNRPQDMVHSMRSPYLEEVHREIAALSQQDIEGLMMGSGMPFNGMAKAAELNGYPGPRHVLDASESGSLQLTEEQQKEIEVLYAQMQTEAISLGEQIVALEQELDDTFSDRTVTEETLAALVQESAQLYGQLRTVHLKYHLRVMGILSADQRDTYNKVRGYTAEALNDPCTNVPEGAHGEMWKKHHNCQ